MKDKVQLEVKNTQTLDDNQKEEVNYKGEGILYLKKNKYYLIYDDNSTGLDGVKTTLIINRKEKRVLLIRAAPYNLKQVFKKDKSSEGYYQIGQGKLKLKIISDSLFININNNAGKLIIRYKSYIEENFLAENKLEVKWTKNDI